MNLDNNNAISNRFRVTFSDPDLRILEDRVTSLIIPGLSLRFLTVPNQIRNVYRPGKSVDVLDMSLTVKLDEEFKVWKKMFAWILDNTSLDTIDFNRIVSDCSITVLSNKYNPLFVIELTDIFPYSLSDLPLDINIAEPSPIFIDIIFKVDSIKLV